MLGEKPNGWRACPICHEKFHERELRSALLLPATQFNHQMRSASVSAEEKFLAEAYQVDFNKPRDHMIMKLMQRSSVRIFSLSCDFSLLGLMDNN
jgi:hypothetical protein